MLVPKLIFADLRRHKIRVMLTVASIMLSVSLVVAVTSGYASGEGAAKFYMDRFIGSTDAVIMRHSHEPISESIVNELRADPHVAAAVARLEDQSQLLDSDGKPLADHAALLIGIDRPADHNVDTLALEAGHWFNTNTGDVAVIDQVAAKALNVTIGGFVNLPAPDHPFKLKVVAIVHKPGILASHLQAIYLPLKTLQAHAMPGQPPQVSRIAVELKPGADVDAFHDRWQTRLDSLDENIVVRLTRDRRKQLDKNLEAVHALSFLGGTISMLAAAFIVLSTLSMGVAERQRTLAMLRAIGMVRQQVGRLVMGEGVVLAVIGASLGIPLGLLFVKILTSLPRFHDVLAAGVVISWGGVALGFFGSIIAALLASLLPAFNAMRVSPLEAMVPLAKPSRSRIPWMITLIGIALALVDVVDMHGLFDAIFSRHLARPVKFYGHFLIGLPTLMLGFFLLAPITVILVERVIGPIVAAMFGLRFALLRQQLSGGIWRAAGTAAALMVGLAVLVVMNVQGNSMLQSWKLPDKFPDLFITSPLLSPFDQKEIAKIESTPGIKKNECMPIAIASPEFTNPIFAMVGAAVIPNATMFFGVDPDKAFDLMQLDFRQGNATQAKALLKKGRHIIVTQEFHEIKGLNLGDKLSLMTPRHGAVDYTIAGVVWSPGIDVIVSMQDMGRMFDQRTAASVFGSLADAREDFGIDRYFLVAANLNYHVEKEQILRSVQQRLGTSGIQVGDVRQIKYTIESSFHKLLLYVSTVALAAMAVASLGVTNTIMASVRSRRWQFGVLRSIGVTRSQLLRLVLAEATLLGVCGVALGLAAGAVMSYNARALGDVLLGHVPQLAIPWNIVGLGSAAVIVVALVASIWPAWSVSHKAPLALLQAGRASA